MRLPLFFLAVWHIASLRADSLPALAGSAVPQNLTELWGEYDPRKEALEVEVTKEWEQDGVVCRVVRYRIGVFKGRPAIMAAFYAFPKGAQHLPGILQLHGGGQSASLAAVMTNAKLGYASLSLNWGGNKMSLADGKAYDGPNTDWGSLDATHPPQRNKSNHFAGSTEPDAFTLDAIDSPRNDNWFLVTLAARRALTFLEQQPEVDGTKLGVTGHSMGGRLTVQVTGIDARVKAAVPSCGGSGDVSSASVPGGSLTKRSARDLATRSENPYIQKIAVPTLWFSPTNDFHAHVYNFAATWREVPANLLGLSISPHFNHRHTDDHSLTATLWFEQYLKGCIQLPAKPQVRWTKTAAGQGVQLTITADASRAIRAVRLYATADAHALTAFWRSVPLTRVGAEWQGTLPTLSANDALFAYADVVYEAPVAYHQIPTTPGVGRSQVFALSSNVQTIAAAQLLAAGIQPTGQRDRLIDDGVNAWQDWFQLNWGNPTLWRATTRKIKDPLWRGPAGARLAFEINPEKDATVYVSLTRNAWGAFGSGTGEYVATVPLKANGGWVAVSLGLTDFQPMDTKGAKPLQDWSTLTDLSLSGHATLTINGVKTDLPSTLWKNPASIRIRQLRWVGGKYLPEESAAKELSDSERTQAFNDAIKASLEQEARDRAAKGK